jgi:hypothetical protein
MPRLKTRLLFAVLVVPVPIVLASLSLCASASAQCSPMQQQFQNIALVSSNPFVAEYATTDVSTLVTQVPITSHAGLKSAARDSEGRVRVERSGGKYIVKTPQDAPSETDRESIWICDPSTATFIVLDTANKTATVSGPHGGVHSIAKPAQEQGGSFCSRLFAVRERSPRLNVADLGHQLISGYDAVGIGIRLAPLAMNEVVSKGSNYEELWCSDDLGAAVRQSNASESSNGKGFKNQSTMMNIERREPDASLFQIPSDYTVLEPTSDATPTLSGKVHTGAPLVPSGKPQ